MTTLMTGLLNVFNQFSSPSQTAEPMSQRVNSLQEHLMSVSRPSTEPKAAQNEFSFAPPPMSAKYEPASNVITMPKRQGGRVIFWSQLDTSTEAA